MTKEEALEGSIKKWEDIVAGTGKDNGSSNCPLCRKYQYCDVDDDDNYQVCLGCPVAEKTGEAYCDGSPYTAWMEEMKSLGRPWTKFEADTPKLVELAKAELEFLKSLREVP